VIDVGAIGQEHIGKGAPIFVEAVSQERDFFPKGKGRGSLLGSRAVGLPLLLALDAAEADAFRVVVVQAIEVLLCRNGCAAVC